MEGTEREIADLDSVLFQVEEAEVEDAEGLETVREELEEARIFTVPRKQRMAKESLLPRTSIPFCRRLGDLLWETQRRE